MTTAPFATAAIPIALIGGTVSAIAIIGNALVCCAVALIPRLRRDRGNYLLAALAVVDLCVGLVVVPPATIYLIAGTCTCSLALEAVPFVHIKCRPVDNGRSCMPHVDDRRCYTMHSVNSQSVYNIRRQVRD